jgi:site-specific DNA-methyltransferase (adenine-specific)
MAGMPTEAEPVVVVEGDALEVSPRLHPGSVAAVITDPPYMLGAASARKSADKPMGWADINNAAHWYRAWMLPCWEALADAGSMWVFGNWRTLPVYQCAAAGIGGMSILSVVVWDKMWPSVGSTRGLRQNYELVTLFGKPGFGIEDRGMSDIWQCKWGGHKPTGHPQEKPVPLLRRIVELAAPVGGLVVDPFAGSGTTAVACATAGRECLAVELDPGHAETARRRVAHAMGGGLLALGG